MSRNRAETRSNQDWLNHLGSEGPARDAALSDLRAALVRGLGYALRGWVGTSGREFESLAEDFVQEALLRILEKLHTFEGRSGFLTWAQKVAVRVALAELRRRRWQDVSLEDLTEEGSPTGIVADRGEGPEEASERSDALGWVRRMMAEELTDRQRTAVNAVAFAGMPLEEVARRLNTNRNALYKLMHDARLRLKRRLAREGMSLEQLLSGGRNVRK